MSWLTNIMNRITPANIDRANRLDEYILRKIGATALYPDPSSDAFTGFYTGNGDVFTVINKITEPASTLPVYQYDKDGEIVENGRMIQLLNKPNPWQTREELIEASLSFYLIYGNCYNAYETIPNGLNAGLPLRIDVLPSQWMEIVMGTYLNPVQGYRFYMSSNVMDYPVEQIMHWREFNPDYDYQGAGHLKGMSRLRPILKSVTGSGASYDALVAAFQHHGAVGILTLLGEDGKVQRMTKPFLSSIKQQYRQEYTGAKKAGSIVITDRDHKWTNFGMTVVEMNVIKAIGVFGGKIYDAYNVPSVLMSGSEDKTYANYKEANKALWTNAIKPSMDAYLQKLTMWLAPRFKEEGQYLAADYSEVEALQSDKASMIAWMVQAKAFTKNEIREAAGFERLDDPNMDRIYESMGTVPLEELGMMPGQDMTEEVLKALRIKDYRHAKVSN